MHPVSERRGQIAGRKRRGRRLPFQNILQRILGHMRGANTALELEKEKEKEKEKRKQIRLHQLRAEKARESERKKRSHQCVGTER